MDDRSAVLLSLSFEERFTTVSETQARPILATVGLISAGIAGLINGPLVAFAGMAYGALSIIMPAFAVLKRRQFERATNHGQS